jgi:hypothetical protein
MTKELLRREGVDEEIISSSRNDVYAGINARREGVDDFY